MNSGIYQIRNQISGNRYIGSAIDLRKRWQRHLAALHCGQHHNPHLQSAFDKYGEEAFIFEILKYVAPKNLIEYEQYYFDLLKPEYNIALIAGSLFGFRHTDEALAKMSAAKTGERHPMYGKRHSTETLAKMSEALTGERNPMYGNTGERHYNYGKHLSEETRAKIGAAHIGKRHSAATKRKMSIAQKAYWRRVHKTENQ